MKEYIVWRTYDRQIDCFILEDDEYERAESECGGVIRSRALPGLWIAVDSLLRGDLVAAHRTLQAGLSTTQHAQFAASLARR